MTDNRNPRVAPHAAAVNITVEGPAQLVVATTIASADHGSRSEIAAPAVAEPDAGPPFWHRTSVIWSAVAALAATTTAVLAWVFGS
ncbi:hypothetical protein [Streptomyces capitiformicae]|uniref:Uncharacterized protein n=1 Tax=Streptomyces capitiformicae TaxID=2014920 RepID=A0A919GBY4_9ACTN|nr:hypothetical protein [Streptomyces capitiformicae]GHH81408.1 hypothetical protein GCM10017771_03240 [Streptomyces capitiformicae]